ncbi:MAG: 6-bladed beta-propeller, partial [Bacteroidales bacterium]|nr:6-bladed beta-propeller [Bacteroidales bacterium]
MVKYQNNRIFILNYPFSSLHLKFLLTETLVIVLFFSTDAQDNTYVKHGPDEKNYSIRWVSQYPLTKSKKETKKKQNNISDILLGKENHKKPKRRNKNWFTNLLFGKKPAALVKPMSVLAKNPDTVWIADQGTGSFLQVFDGVGEITQLRNKYIENIPSLVGTCILPGDKILFTDSKLNKIFQFLPGNHKLQILNDSILLKQPTGIAYSSVNKEIWVVETMAHRIAVLNEKGELIKQIGERGDAPGQFNFPTYIWIDKMGTVYVVDAMNFRVQIFDSNGEFVSLFGEIGDASGYFARPKGIATDKFCHIYIADELFHAFKIFERMGKLLYAFGSLGHNK